jgi:hypothetical protein
MSKQNRDVPFVNGQRNLICSEVFPDEDFAASGYWFWLKSAGTHPFAVKAFDQNYGSIRSPELVWSDNPTFKRPVKDLPIAARCVPPDGFWPKIGSARTNTRRHNAERGRGQR